MRTRHLDHEGVRMIAPADIHDIRVLTSTGPIDLPPSASIDPDRQEA